MGNYFQNAAGLLNLLPIREITYKRGDTTLTINAIAGITNISYEDQHGVIVRAKVQDFIVDPADLVISGNLFEPNEGDLIVDSYGPDGIVRTYEVNPSGTDNPWRWTDHHRTRMRIHVKEVDLE